MFEQAVAMGIEVRSVSDSPYQLHMRQGDLVWRTSASRTSVQSSIGFTLAADKISTRKVLKAMGLDSPKFQLFHKLQTPEIDVDMVKPPWVVKPRRGRGGAFVETGLSDLNQVRRIVENPLVTDWIVEESLIGQDYRVVCVDYQLVAAAVRLPAFVIGDGQETIQELIAHKNAHPFRGENSNNYLSNIVVDDGLIQHLEKQGMSLETVPLNQERVSLRSVCNLSKGGEVANVTDSVCRENRDLFEAISRAFDLNIIGIDVMCHSLAVPLDQQAGAGIVEVNASPGLMVHHTPYDPDNSVNVAKEILEMTVRKLTKVN